MKWLQFDTYLMLIFLFHPFFVTAVYVSLFVGVCVFKTFVRSIASESVRLFLAQFYRLKCNSKEKSTFLPFINNICGVYIFAF